MLSEFYKAQNFPEKERIQSEKNILFITPNKDYDLKPVLKRLGLSKWEVAVTYPKDGLDMLSEIMSAKPKLIIQVGALVMRKFPFLPDDGSMDAELKARAESVLADDYVNLHHHDEFSIKDGLGTVVNLNKLLNAQRRSFCCITNHGSVGGWIKQYNSCKKDGVKAIFGMEAYVSDYRGDDPEEKKKHRSAYHLVLIAKTMEGFDNIIKIHNDAQMNGFYYTPRANKDTFKQFGKGIISSTACMAGELPNLLMAGEKDKAKEFYEFYKGCFDEFYVEIQIIEYEAQREANRRLIEFAREVGAPLVLTCDSHYLEGEHADTHDVLMCIRQHKTLFDEKGEESADLWNFDVKNMFCRSAEQMRQVFENGFVDKDGKKFEPFKDEVFTEEVFREAMANTRKIAVSTEDIKLDSTIKLPRLYDDGAKILKTKVNAGFINRMLDKKPNYQEYRDRLSMEYDTIVKLGWSDYFLVMEKIISDTVKEHGEWSVGYGRGSAAGSLVSYCLGLTDVEPLKYGLLFERFLDASRPTPPDIDTDFDPRVREWVKEHIVEMFGSDHVCSIGTYQTYRTRAVILDVARALNEDLNVANEVTKKIDPLDSFDDDEGEEKKVDKLSFDELCKHYPELKAYFDSFPVVRYHAEILRNQVKNMGTHAGGVIISDINLKGRIPVLYDKPGNPEERKVISAWAEAGGNEELSSVGLVKFDILGLNNLPIISDCVKLINNNRGIEIKRWEIPIDDSKTIRMASKKDLVGIFQLDSPATKPVADAVEMESLEDVAAVTSLIRPGPRDMGMDIEYAERKHGKPYAMPEVVKELLLDTYGVMTFQEDIMRIAQKIGGFTPTESYKFLKICAKKQGDLFPVWRDKFIKGSQKMIDDGLLVKQDVENLADQLAAFANYGFNKSVDISSPVWCNGVEKKIGEVIPGDTVESFDGNRMVKTEVVANHDHGILPAFEVEFDGGEKVICSVFHKFETEEGKIPLWRLLLEGQKVYHDDNCGKMEMSNMFSGDVVRKEVEKTSDGNETLSSCSGESFELRRVREGVVWDKESLQTSSPLCQGSVHSQFKQDGGEPNKGCFAEGCSASRRNKNQDFTSTQDSDDATAPAETSFRKHEKVECRPGILSKDDGSNILGITENINASGGNCSTICHIEEVEGGTSRGIQGNLDKNEQIEKEFQGRNLAVGECFGSENVQEKDSSSVLNNGQGNRLCKQECMDRGGWLLAFWNRIYRKEIFPSTDSRKGYSSQQGSGTQGRNADSVGIGLLEGQRTLQTEGRMDCFSEEHDSEPKSGSVSLRKVLSARFVGFRHMCDLEVSHPSHNFTLANGIITSNSHAITYSAVSTAELWLKYNYPIEYITSLINNSKMGKKKHGEDIFVGYVNYARRSGIEVLPPDISMSLIQFAIWDGKVLYSLEHIKGVASMAEVISRFQPFASIEDFYERVKVESVSSKGKTTSKRPNKGVVENLIEAGAFDKFGPGGSISQNRNAIMAEYYRVRASKKDTPPEHTDEEWIALETEVLGLNLSQPPLFRQYETIIRQKGWRLICEIEDRKRVCVFGKILSITPKTSKTGNPMYVVTITDGLDNLTYFVFKGTQQFFKDHFKIGSIAAMPLNKFDEGDMRFYDDKKDFEIIKK